MSTRSSSIPESLGIIAGRGAYPRILAESARAQGVKRLFAVAFKGETDPVLQRLVDDIAWIRIGQLRPLVEAFRASGVKEAVMAGQIKPGHLFSVRFDADMMRLLGRLQERNAHTIFGAVCDELAAVGVSFRPASLFMEQAMPPAGLLTPVPPTQAQEADIALGLQVARTTSGLDIGQTVVVKDGTILAVEAFEGTDRTIRRAGELAGPGAVVVKVAKPSHDVRFDLPVVGSRTLESLRKAGAAVLAFQAGRTILLEKDLLVRQAIKQKLCLVAVEMN